MAPHIHEKIDFTVEVFIVFKNKVLLRMHDKYNMWLSVGGHIELHEDPIEAGVREVKEEVGLDVELVGNPAPSIKSDPLYRELMPPKFMNRHNIGKAGHEHISLVYFAKTKSDAVVVQMNGDRSDEWRWFTAAEIEQNNIGLNEDIKYYALAALDQLGE